MTGMEIVDLQQKNRLEEKTNKILINLVTASYWNGNRGFATGESGRFLEHEQIWAGAMAYR